MATEKTAIIKMAAEKTTITKMATENNYIGTFKNNYISTEKIIILLQAKI